MKKQSWILLVIVSFLAGLSLSLPHGAYGQQFALGGEETGGLMRGPAFQTFDASGNLILTRFVLNSDFTAVSFSDIEADGDFMFDEILVGGAETGGLMRGPAFQIWDENGNLLVTRFVLNADFDANNLGFDVGDNDGNGIEEVIAFGAETAGLMRGPAFQFWDVNGNHLVTRFFLNPDFTNVQHIGDDDDGPPPGP